MELESITQVTGPSTPQVANEPVVEPKTSAWVPSLFETGTCWLTGGVYAPLSPLGHVVKTLAPASCPRSRDRGCPRRPRAALEPPSAPHRTRALAALCEELTASETTYPGTDLTLVYEVKQR